MKSGLERFLIAGLVVLTIPFVASAQSGTLPFPTTRGGLPAGSGVVGTGTVVVHLLSETELPVSAIPQMTLTADSDNIAAAAQFPRRTGGNDWVFTGLATGIGYELDVRVDGYEPAHETVELPDVPGGSTEVAVNLRPINQQLVFHPPGGQFVLAPRAQKEVQQGLRDLQSNKISSAQKHFQRAIALAPTNPYVNYVMGMSYVLAKEEPKAQPYLEESVSMDPNQAASLLALGTVRFNQSNYSGAVDVLNKAVKLDPGSWKAQWLLAASYLKQRDFLDARDHAEKSLVAGKGEAEGVRLVIAEAAAGMGDRAGALATVNNFLADHPNSADGLAIRKWLISLPSIQPSVPRTVAQSALTTPTFQAEVIAVPAAVPHVDLPPKPGWAPSDIDEQKPYLVNGAACSLPKVLKAAGRNAVQLVSELEEFSAVEEYQTVEIKHDENLEKPVSRNFNYMVFIEHPSAKIIQVNEFRDEGVTADQMPGELSDLGAPGLVLVFHPLLQGDFAWSCEGLGEWQHKPAWVVRFEQRSDRPNRLLNFQSATGAYPLPMKGRAWVAERGGEVLHLDTDLVAPVREINLKREHFAIDYEAVIFPKHKVTLWLPENVNAYFQYRGHYFHHYHHFSQFKLFSVNTNQKIAPPKGTGDTEN